MVDINEINQKSKVEKEQIIGHQKGPAVVVAGPGSGKTTTMVERIVQLCCISNCNPNSIYAITFTNQAVQDIRDKIAELCKKQNREKPEIYIGTMHSLAKGLLHKYSNRLSISSKFRIVHKHQEEILIDDIRHDLKKNARILGNFQNRYVSRFKALRAFVPAYKLNQICKLPIGEKYATQEQFNEHYRQLLNYYNCIDWYDVVSLSVILLRNNPGIQEEFASKINHLLVDEYQDLNQADHQLIRLISIKSQSFMAFGDDDQSIYESGRFANPGGILRFISLYPGAKIYPLSICWRCSSSILDAAWKLVSVDEHKLPNRMPKPKPLTHPDNGTGDFEICKYKSEKDEKSQLCLQIHKIVKKLKPKTILVLFQMRKLGQMYIDAFIESGLQVDNCFIQNLPMSEALFILHEILCLLINKNDNMAIRFLAKKLYKINAAWFAKIRFHSKKHKRSMWEEIINTDDKTTKRLEPFVTDIKRWSEMDSISDLVTDIGVKLNLNTDQELRDIINLCEQDKFDSVDKIIEYIRTKGHDLEEQSKDVSTNSLKKIKVMTMHSAKGLTADAVFIPVLEDELLPNQKLVTEQRRLLYVSMTRAKKYLFLSWAWSRHGEITHKGGGGSPINRHRSRFLDEITRRCGVRPGN